MKRSIHLLAIAACFLTAMVGAIAQQVSPDLIAKLPEAGPWTLSAGDFRSTSSANKVLFQLLRQKNALSSNLWSRLSATTQRDLNGFAARRALVETITIREEYLWPMVDYLLPDLNKLIEAENLYDAKLFSPGQLAEDTMQLVASKPQGKDVARLNRMLLEDAYSPYIAKRVRAVRDPANGRFAVVNHKKMEITFYRDDGTKISFVDVGTGMQQASMTDSFHIGYAPQFELKFTPSVVDLTIGRCFARIGIESGIFSPMGCN